LVLPRGKKRIYNKIRLLVKMKHWNLIVIGSGPAGYTAAIYGARACLSTLIICGNTRGGQLTTTTDVENYPGFADVIQGPWLVEQMEKQAIHAGAEVITDYITHIDHKSHPFVLTGEGNTKYSADSIVIATGANAKWLGLESETKFRGYGVSSCATCDGFFYRNKDVLVVGGGNTAVEESMYLSKIAKSVTLIHRRDSLRAEKTLQNKMFENPKIKVLWNTVLDEVIGNEEPLGVTGAVLKNAVDGSKVEVKLDGIFIAIGHSPNSSFVKNLINIDDEGYIITEKGSTRTNVPGIFAAGDVQDKIYRQAVTAAGTGCMAALEAEKFIISL
jgi:thioredoxin reductase (NADPH)